MHPIHVLVGAAATPWQRYDAVSHVLREVPGSEPHLGEVWRAAEEVLPTGRGLLLALVAEPGRTAAKYKHPDSLIWRDAGVMLGYMSVVAEVLNLPFCPLGITAEDEFAKLLQPPARLFGAGLALLGGCPHRVQNANVVC